MRRCENLMPARVITKKQSMPTALAVAPLPKIAEGAYSRVEEFDGQVIVSDNDTLYSLNPRTGENLQLFMLSGRVLKSSLVSGDGNSLTIFTDKDYLIVEKATGGGLNCRAVAPEAVGMPFFTGSAGSLHTFNVASRTLSKSYSDTEEVRATDTAVLTSDLVAAYRQITNMAGACGDFLQPCTVRYRLLDKENNEIFTSPHILVGSAQVCGAQTLIFADSARNAVMPYTVSATGTELHLHIPAGTSGIFAETASRLEVLVSPALQPYEPGAPLDCKRKVNATANQFALLRLPGASFGQFSPASASAPSMLKRMIAVGTAEQVVKVIETPFGSETAADIHIEAPVASVETEIARLRGVLSAPIKAASRAQAYVSAPHRITARVSASASGVTLSSGISVERFRGYELPLMATSAEGDASWRAVVSVLFTDGSRLSMPAEGVGGAPLKVSPIVTYPAPDVASIAIQLHVQGSQLRVMSLPMTTDASHRRSVFISDGLLPPVWREVDGALTVPPDIISPLSFPGVVAVSPQGSLFSVFTLAGVTGKVNALVPGARALGAWDFGRARFLCGGEGGLHALTVNADRTTVAVNLLHPGRVDTPAGMVQALDGEVAAIASGDLITVRGSNVTTRIAGIGAGELAWEPSRRQLWFVGRGADCARVICPDFGYRGFTVTTGQVNELASTASGVLIFTAEGIYRPTASGDGTELTEVAWSNVYSGSWSGRLRVEVPMTVSYFDGTVSILHRHLDGDGAVMAEYAVCGSIHSPLVLSALVPYCNALMLKVEGSASDDFMLREPHIGK